MSTAPAIAWPVGDYVIRRPIGYGNFGTVYEAFDQRTGGPVALKLVPSTGAPEAEAKLAAERHGAILQERFGQCCDMVPKIVEHRPYDEGFYGIAMEFVGGRRLSDVILAGMTPREATEYALRLCAFLDQAHKFETTIDGEKYDRIVHADLKPDNVLVPSPGTIKVLDFGIAKAMSKSKEVTTNLWGTRPYASPERLQTGKVNEQVDYWSLGVILYEMVSQHLPYPSLDHRTGRLEDAIRNNEPRAPLPESCPRPLAAIINKLLAFQPERRYASAALLAADLEAVLNARPPQAEAEFAKADQETIRIAPPRSRAVPATDPLPATGAAPPSPTVPASTAAGASTARRPRSRVLRFARRVILFFMLLLLVREAAAWIGAERLRERIAMLDPKAVAQVEDDYERLKRWGPFDMGLRLRVQRPLVRKLTALADNYITAFREERSNVAQGEWQRAADWMRWARQFDPGNRSLAARERYCEGHVLRIEGRGLSGPEAEHKYAQAIRAFRDAADLDPSSPDPYLGLLRTYIYHLLDVDRAVEAIRELEKRYQTGRREQAQLGDGYWRSGDRSRLRARRLTGDHRQAELEKALTYYNECVATFAPIVEYANAAANMETCKRRAADVSRQLESDAEQALLERLQ